MTNSNAPRGAQSFNGIMSTKFDLRVTKYLVDASDATPLFINDLVKTTGQSDEQGIPIVTKISSQNDFIVGIVVDFEKDADANLLLYRKANTRRIVHVCDDPFVKFEMQVSGAFTLSDTGKKANLIIGSGDTTLGLSTTQLDSTSFTNNDAQIKMLRLVEREDNALGTHAKVECTVFKHEAFFFDGVVAGENIFFARQNGDDTQDGKSWEEAFETGGKIIDESNAIASVSTPVEAFFADSGSYDIGGKTINDYVHVLAPSAIIYGNFIYVSPNASFTARQFGLSPVGGFMSFATADPDGISIVKIDYVNTAPSGTPSFRVLSSSSINIDIGIFRLDFNNNKDGIYINNAASIKNVIRIGTLIIGTSDGNTGINIDAGHATIVIGQIIKEGTVTNSTGIKVAAGATADITILGKNEADTPLNVSDHNHNIISTDQGILIRGKRPLFSAKGYASTQPAEIHTSFAEGTPAAPATISPTADLGTRRWFGERQDAVTPGQKEYANLYGTTKAGDIDDGGVVLTVNEVKADDSVINHEAFKYYAKTGGGAGELGVPFTVAGLPVDKFTLHGGHVNFGTPQQIGSPAAQIAYDGSLPAIGEGTLISDGGSKHFSIPYALKSTANELKFTLSLTVWVDANVYVTVAVFESTGSSCIGKRTIEISGLTSTDNLKPLDYTFYFDPGSTVSRTYTARIGPSGASALTVNGEVAGEGLIVNYSSFTIEEVPA